MAVAPDLLLSSASEVRPKASPKPSATPAEPTGGKPSSFARVLADERQSSLGAARQANSKDTADARPDPQQSQNTDAASLGADAVVADSGNPLPGTADPAALLDPLALLGLSVESGEQTLLAADNSTQVALPEGLDAGLDEELLVVAPAPPISPAPATGVVSSEVVIDPEVEKLNSAASVQITLDMARKAEVEKSTAKTTTGLAASPTIVNPPATGEAALKALGGLKPELDSELSAEALGEAEEFGLEVSAKSLEAFKGAAGDSAGDSQGARLSLLGQAVSQAQAAQAQRALVPGQPIALQQTGWSEAVVERVMWLSSQNLRSADIQLDPAELGRLDVRVTLNQDQAQVSFSSPHAMVREALESQMHRMRELFAQQGINQLDVSVSDQSQSRNFQGQQDAEQAAQGNAAAGLRSRADEEQAPLNELRSQALTHRGLVDFYA